jgi:hypothetical protein
MKSHTFVKVKPPIKPPTQTSFSDLTPEELVKPAPKVEIEQEQLEPVVVTDAFLEAPRDESVYGCGWSLTELLNEVNSR